MAFTRKTEAQRPEHGSEDCLSDTIYESPKFLHIRSLRRHINGGASFEATRAGRWADPPGSKTRQTLIRFGYTLDLAGEPPDSFKPAKSMDTSEEHLVQRCGELGHEPFSRILDRFGLELNMHGETDDLPGSYWGAPEAGLVGQTVHIRADTPIHSLLHEAGHVICMDSERRSALHTEAGGEDVEENSVCYLQILLADHLPAVGRQRLMLDMDRWGYSFRLGSTRAWFEEDAGDARQWLIEHRLIDDNDEILWRLRA